MSIAFRLSWMYYNLLNAYVGISLESKNIFFEHPSTELLLSVIRTGEFKKVHKAFKGFKNYIFIVPCA